VTRNENDRKADDDSVVKLIPSGDATPLRLTHCGPDRAGRDRHDAGRDFYFARFPLVFGGKDPSPDLRADPSYRHHGEA